VIALVLAETAAGGTAILWLTGLWGSVKRGFFILSGSVAFGCALIATAAVWGSIDGGGAEAKVVVLLGAGTCLLLAGSTTFLLLRLEWVARFFGLLAIPASTGLLLMMAEGASISFSRAVLQVLTGAAFMGAVMEGLLLGHWYLVDRRLPRTHIQRLAILLVGAVALETAMLAVSGFEEVRPAAGFSPLLGIGSVATWVALGMAAATAMIAVLIVATLRGTESRAVQAATGFFYIAVITAFAAEMAAKVRLLG
jgi:hypothetical protein